MADLQEIAIEITMLQELRNGRGFLPGKQTQEVSTLFPKINQEETSKSCFRQMKQHKNTIQTVNQPDASIEEKMKD